MRWSKNTPSRTLEYHVKARNGFLRFVCKKDRQRSEFAAAVYAGELEEPLAWVTAKTAQGAKGKLTRKIKAMLEELQRGMHCKKA